MMAAPDVIVIGAGVVGAACALALTEASLEVLVLDRSTVASGTSGAGEGMDPGNGLGGDRGYRPPTRPDSHATPVARGTWSDRTAHRPLQDVATTRG